MADMTDRPTQPDAREPSEPPAGPRTAKQWLLHHWRTNIRPILLVVVVLLTVRSVAADWYDVPSGSMRPTILEGDRIAVNKLAYDLKVPFTRIPIVTWSQPSRGEIITFGSPVNGQRLVKRVIAVGGDTVEAREGRLYINGRPLAYTTVSGGAVGGTGVGGVASETVDGVTHAVRFDASRHRGQVQQAPRTFGPATVPDGHVFVMGDNRDNSRDSRVWGSVPFAFIKGRAEFIWWSYREGEVRWDRMFSAIR